MSPGWKTRLEVFEEDWFITDTERDVLEGFLEWYFEGTRPSFRTDPREIRSLR